MNFLIRWIPTFAAAAILTVAGFVLRASARRDERRREGLGPRDSGLGR